MTRASGSVILTRTPPFSALLDFVVLFTSLR